MKESDQIEPDQMKRRDQMKPDPTKCPCLMGSPGNQIKRPDPDMIVGSDLKKVNCFVMPRWPGVKKPDQRVEV